MQAARVLLVEDDALLRRYVRMGLRELPLQLLECDSVAAAMELLATTPVQVIVTDLMLAGASGMDLLQNLQLQPGLQAQAKTVVLSAGLTPEVREKLAALGVWRMLAKPVSLQQLEDCVMEALGQAQDDSPTLHQPPALSAEDLDGAVQQYFAGDRELFDSYRSACLLQFVHDVRTGDAASASSDMQALRRTAHSLKTVLQTLGHASLSAQALALEALCHAGHTSPALQAWAGLRAQLLALAEAAE